MPGIYQGKTVPIKVIIGLRPNGHADHPDWSKLPLVIAGGRAEDHMAGGWVYDKSSGHQESDAESPLGQQLGILFVSEQMADECVATFPATISKMLNEAQLENFIESRCTAHLDEFDYDADALNTLKTERDLLVSIGQPTAEVDTRIAKALDPNDPTRGKRQRIGKTWESVKASRKIDLSNSVTRRQQ